MEEIKNASKLVTAEQAKQQSIDMEITDLNLKITCAAISRKTHISYFGNIRNEVKEKLEASGFNVIKKRFSYKISW